MKVTIFGTGYVGLVQGAVLAAAGHQVMCVDVDQDKIDGLKLGVIPIYEPGLDDLVEQTTRQRQLRFTTDAQEGIEHAQVLFIAVGTPPGEDGSADLRHVLAVAKTIGQHMNEPKIIVDKSTVPVGTADKVKETVSAQLLQREVSVDFHVVSNPEFLKEGCAVQDALKPDRIIIGTDSAHAEETMRELYASFNRNHDKILKMDVRSAELTKYAANCMLATKISFMNEMAILAEKLGADIESVRKGIGSDPRIGYHFIYPGPGYGGSCFPKDVQALIRTAHSVGFDPMLLESVEKRNEAQKQVVFSKLLAHFKGDLAGKTIAIWGLSFKPNTDDMRQAPSLTLIDALLNAGAVVRAFDPQAMEEVSKLYAQNQNVQLTRTQEQCAFGADALVVMTEWKCFASPDFEQLKKLLNQPVLVDARNSYSPEKLKKAGFSYYGIGRV